jgi:phosphate transport system permease protein
MARSRIWPWMWSSANSIVITDDGFIHYYNVANKSAPKLIDRHSVAPQGVAVTSLSFLAGGISILLGDSRGRISQWFPVRDENNK